MKRKIHLGLGEIEVIGTVVEEPVSSTASATEAANATADTNATFEILI